MLHFEINHQRCLRSKGVDCRNCVDMCMMHILGIKNNMVTISAKVLEEHCIFCGTCQGSCMVDENVIKIWDDENPSLTPLPVVIKKIVHEQV